MSNLSGFYIHIPFCHSICTYCDFYKMMAKPKRIETYIHYLVQEIELKKPFYKDLKTIYIGGGTPSALPHPLLDYLLFHIESNVDIQDIEEYTIEANPNDVNKEFSELLMRYRINRVSLGVQSFQEEKLKLLGRKHQEVDVKRAMKILKDAGIANLNVDLIYGIKTDTFSKIKEDIDKAIQYGAVHLSLYSLIVEDKTIIKKQYDNGKFETLNEDSEAALYQKICAYLKKKGFVHYEISNFSKKNYQCKHNLLYWDNMNYIGAGASSSYYIGNTRYTNAKNLDDYFSGIETKKLKYSEITRLTIEDQMKEEMILGLRKTEGVNIKKFNDKFQTDFYSVFPIAHKLLSLGLLEVRGDVIFIPQKKLFLSNEVLVNFI